MSTVGQSGTLLITGATVWDGTGDAVREDVAMRIAGSRIAAIGRTADFGAQPVSGAEIDGHGLFLMPGLINMHEHLIFRGTVGPPAAALGRGAPELTIHAVRVAATALAQGITTVRDMGTKFEIALRLRDAIGAGQILGPRILACNSAIRVTGGHGYQAVHADGVAEFQRAARTQLAAGADFIKVMASHDPTPMPGPEPTRPECTVDELRAAFEVAHDWGHHAGCHVMGSTAISRALDAGANVIEHGHFLTEDQAIRMARDGVTFTPTLSAYNVQTMHPRFKRGAAWKAAHDALRSGHASAMRAAVSAGVAMVVGTDSVGCYAEEVDLLRKAGVGTLESLRACTSNAARALGLDQEIGTISVGRMADIIALRADPRTDPYALEQVQLVIREGRVHRPADLVYAESALPAEVSLTTLVRSPSSA